MKKYGLVVEQGRLYFLEFVLKVCASGRTLQHLICDVEVHAGTMLVSACVFAGGTSSTVDCTIMLL